MRTLFLADAHLSLPTDPNYRALVEFLDGQDEKIDRLALLGDIFEFWPGHRCRTLDIHQPFLACLDRLKAGGTRLLYVEGNHDFHLAPYFADRFECTILPDGGPVEIGGHRVFLAHGDLANPADTGYRFLRLVLRSPLTRLLMRSLPPELVRPIAEHASSRSRRSSRQKNRHWPAREILIPYAKRLFREGCDIVVTGHYHQPFHEKLAEGELIALGDWITQYSYAVCEGGVFSLKTYSPSF